MNRRELSSAHSVWVCGSQKSAPAKIKVGIATNTAIRRRANAGVITGRSGTLATKLRTALVGVSVVTTGVERRFLAKGSDHSDEEVFWE